MAVTTDRQYRQILSASIAYRKAGIEDLVHNSNPVMAAIRANGNVRTYSGPEIRHHLLIDKQQAQWYTGYDKLRNSPIELINDAVFTPKNVAVPISFAGTELLANQGSTRQIDLMDTYLEQAENSMVDAFEVAINGDGTADGGRQLVGLGAALPIVTNTGTYGGINRATYALWRTTTFDAQTDFPLIGTQVDATTVRPIYESILAQRSRGTRGADLLIASREHYLAYSASLVAHQRITSGGLMGRLGFTALEFAGAGRQAEVVLASGIGTSMPSNTTYGLESRSIYLYYHPDRNMVPLFDGDGQMPLNQDATAQFLVWNGEFVLGNPLFAWRLIDSNPNA